MHFSPDLLICELVMFLIRVVRQEQFNRFLWFLASSIKTGATLRKCYLFSCRYRLSIWLQNNPYFCVFKYARAVKQKVWNEVENRERDWGEITLKIPFFFSLRALKTLTTRFTNFFTDFEKKNRLFCSLSNVQRVWLPCEQSLNLSSILYA